MGLDMYLTAKKYVWRHTDDGQHERKEIAKAANVPNGWDAEGVTCEVGYWRKANAIHGWFVENVQHGEDDCREYPVTRDDLQKLYEDIHSVLNARMRAQTALDKLPPTDGPFFGSYDLDEDYYEELKRTQDIIVKALAAPTEWDFYYSSSW